MLLDPGSLSSKVVCFQANGYNQGLILSLAKKESYICQSLYIKGMSSSFADTHVATPLRNFLHFLLLLESVVKALSF